MGNRESRQRIRQKCGFGSPGFRLPSSLEEAVVASCKCYVNSLHCHLLFGHWGCHLCSLGYPFLAQFPTHIRPPFRGCCQIHSWVDKDQSRCLCRRLSRSSAEWPTFFVLCTNPLPFMGLQPLGYLSYLIAREHISGVPG